MRRCSVDCLWGIRLRGGTGAMTGCGRTGRGVDFVVMINVVRDGHVMGVDWERICRRRGKFWGCVG